MKLFFKTFALIFICSNLFASVGGKISKGQYTDVSMEVCWNLDETSDQCQNILVSEMKYEYRWYYSGLGTTDSLNVWLSFASPIAIPPRGILKNILVLPDLPIDCGSGYNDWETGNDNAWYTEKSDGTDYNSSHTHVYRNGDTGSRKLTVSANKDESQISVFSKYSCHNMAADKSTYVIYRMTAQKK